MLRYTLQKYGVSKESDTQKLSIHLLLCVLLLMYTKFLGISFYYYNTILFCRDDICEVLILASDIKI